jgi:hypothetical protein
MRKAAMVAAPLAAAILTGLVGLVPAGPARAAAPTAQAARGRWLRPADHPRISISAA